MYCKSNLSDLKDLLEMIALELNYIPSQQSVTGLYQSFSGYPHIPTAQHLDTVTLTATAFMGISF
jgi:hypothetical protein